jgi:predicted GNAT family acetyltransferase
MASRTPTDDDKLDETLEETFPASDAPANTVATGVHLDVGASSSDAAVHDRREANRFEAEVGGQVAYLSYERRPDAMVLLHTEVPESLRGRGIAARLAKAGIASARAEGLRVVAVCQYVRTYLRRHPA